MDVVEQQLIARAIAARDDKAFGGLVRMHQSTVRLLLLRLTRGNDALADDLAQETFLTAFRKINSYRSDGAFSGWLYAIAYRAFLQFMRKQKPPPEQIAEETKRDDSVAARIDIEKALYGLSIEEKSCITLCYTYGMTHIEASAVMDMPLGTVKSHIARGKEKLRVSLIHWSKEVSA